MNSKYGGSMGQQRLIKTIKTIGGGGGGALTANSVDSVHILNGAVDTDEINDGSITIPKFAPDFVAVLQEFADRIMNLEKFAIQRTLDVVVSNTFKHNIDIDLLTYESVQIDFLLKFTGTNNVPLKIEPVNVSTAQPWEEYNGRIIGGNNGTPTTLTKTSHNGVVLHQLETQGLTASISCKIFKVYDQGVHFGRYSFTSTGVYCFAGVGHSRIDVTAMHNQFRPTALKIHLPSSATLMSFSYSIINDKLITS